MISWYKTQGHQIYWSQVCDLELSHPPEPPTAVELERKYFSLCLISLPCRPTVLCSALSSSATPEQSGSALTLKGEIRFHFCKVISTLRNSNFKNPQ